MSEREEPECVADARKGLEDGRYESCGGFGCRSHSWHLEELVNAYDALRAQLTTAERERDEARRERDEAMAAMRHFRNAEAALRAGFHRNALTADAAVVDGLVKQCKELGHRAERMERAVRAVRDAYNEQLSDSEKDAAWVALMQTLDAAPTQEREAVSKLSTGSDAAVLYHTPSF